MDRKQCLRDSIETVVTAFPSQWTREEAPEDRPSGDDERIIAALAAPDARGRVLNALYGDQISQVLSVTDLICLIIEKCSGLFHPTPQEVSDPFDYLEVFNVAIGETVSRCSVSIWSYLKDKAKIKHYAHSLP